MRPRALERFDTWEKNPSIAVSDEYGRLRYSDLYDLSLKGAGSICKRCEDNFRPVAIVGDNSVGTFAAIISTLVAGRPYCFIDVQEKQKRISDRLAKLEPSCVVDPSRYLQRHGIAFHGVVFQNDELFTGTTAEMSGVPGSEFCYVLFTSGSTGEPKGICVGIKASNLALQAYEKAAPTRSDEVVINEVSFSFDVGALDIFYSLSNMVEMKILPPNQHDSICASAYGRPWSFFTVPTVIDDLTQANVDLPNQGRIFLTGEKIGSRVYNSLSELAGGGVSSYNFYGMTEAPWVSHKEIAWGDSNHANALDFPSASDPVQVEISEEGEIVLDGEGLFSGYVDPDFDFLHDVGNQGKFYTGDFAKSLDERTFLFLGRRDRHVRYHGYRIELGDIESLIESCDASVLAYVSFDEDRDELSVQLAHRNSQSISKDRLRRLKSACQGVVPDFMFPTTWRTLDVAPRTISGKKNRSGDKMYA